MFIGASGLGLFEGVGKKYCQVIAYTMPDYNGKKCYLLHRYATLFHKGCKKIKMIYGNGMVIGFDSPTGVLPNPTLRSAIGAACL
jgi:hypothetical protein